MKFESSHRCETDLSATGYPLSHLVDAKQSGQIIPAYSQLSSAAPKGPPSNKPTLTLGIGQARRRACEAKTPCRDEPAAETISLRANRPTR